MVLRNHTNPKEEAAASLLEMKKLSVLQWVVETLLNDERLELNL